MWSHQVQRCNTPAEVSGSFGPVLEDVDEDAEVLRLATTDYLVQDAGVVLQRTAHVKKTAVQLP